MSRRILCASFVAWSLLALPALAVVIPHNGPALEKEFRHDDLYVPEVNEPLNELDQSLAASLQPDLAAFGIKADSAFYDSRIHRWTSLILSTPIVPGTGARNTLQWAVGPQDDTAFKTQVLSAVRSYLDAHQSELKIDMTQLERTPRIGVFEKGAIIFVHVARVVGGIPVRENSIGVAINHGNLVLLGLEKWGDINISLVPAVSADTARAAVQDHIKPLAFSGFVKDAHLELIPMMKDGAMYYRLAWVLVSKIAGDSGTWEGLVDASTGELFAFQDTNDYVQAKIVGGAYPVSNDQRPPDGIEQTNVPMPYADINGVGGTTYADSGGNIGCITGSIQTALSGLFVKIHDDCGAVNESASGSLDLGSGPLAASTDCTVPGGHSAGDTKSSRSGYYELNRLKETARAYLPDNVWLKQQLTAEMNENDVCNAFWDGTQVNFFRSSPPDGCANTGEIAGVFDHEWGHGLDNNGVNPNITSPGESIADINAEMRLDTSCVGRGFLTTTTCGGYGDKCSGTVLTGCTGVRELDFVNHRCDQPHTISWIQSGFTSVQCGGTGTAAPCPASGQRGPCNKEVHCEGMVTAEAAWDLQLRDLRAAPFNLDENTALELTNRLFFLGQQTVTSWYTCNVGGGCGATGGYLLLLAADDDNGNLNDGTPHMQAIKAAFNRHEIACTTPAVVNSGCAGGPTTVPTVTVVPGDSGAQVSWDAVPGAETYKVFRTEGVNACHFGKVIVGETSDLTFSDSGLLNGRTYYYSVQAVGANPICTGPMAACQTVVAAAGPNLAVLAGSSLSITGGDGDNFLDNCEQGTLTFTVANVGTGTLTNVRIVAVTPLTHPLTTIDTPLPAPIIASLAECDTAPGSFSFTPQGMTFLQTTQLQVDVTADELGGAIRSQILSVAPVQADAVAVASRTYGFETDLSGWTVQSGTFVRAAGGANGTGFDLHSSVNQDNHCDIVRSPAIRLTGTSTLSLYNHYNTETPIPTPYDRANIGVVDLGASTRTTIIPDSGRPYDVPQGSPNGSCVLANQGGWAGNQPAFALSNWSSAAVNPSGTFTGKTIALEVAYGTDGSAHGTGFHFDEVTVTNFEDVVPDAQVPSCGGIVQLVAPQALVVDAAGNGVLQPNEAVIVQPGWHNGGNVPIALTGTASNFTGPVGPQIYNLTDSSADYGTIAVGLNGSCTDCYGLSITAVTRPSVHWDATLDETVTPTSTNKTWTLHVGDSFTDVTTASGFYKAIETILHNNVTAGCGDGTVYCPSDSVTREQMAKFLLRAKEGPGYTPPACVTPTFTDVPCSDGFAPWVNEIANRGITAGCGDGTTYSPFDPTAREQMALLLLKTLLGSGYVPPPCTGTVFTDVTCSSGFDKWIEDLFARGITAGCGDGTTFCPGDPVPREQMAVFLTRTFSLVLYGP